MKCVVKLGAGALCLSVGLFLSIIGAGNAMESLEEIRESALSKIESTFEED